MFALMIHEELLVYFSAFFPFIIVINSWDGSLVGFARR